MSTVVFPGSFDPITLGHVNIISRAAAMFDTVIVAVAVNSAKTAAFSAPQRIDFINRSLAAAHIRNVKVMECNGLLAEFAAKNNACAIIRGVRTITDYSYELSVAAVNRHINKTDTVLLPADDGFAHISSSTVKELAAYGGDISDYVCRDIMPEVISGLSKNADKN